MSSDSSRKVGGLRDVNERRKCRRYDLGESGTIWSGGLPFDCIVKDISASGALVEAQVETDLAPPEGSRIELEVPRFGRLSGEVIRVIGPMVGVRFDSEIALDPSALVPPMAALA